MIAIRTMNGYTIFTYHLIPITGKIKALQAVGVKMADRIFAIPNY